MAAGIIALCDEVARLIKAAWNPTAPNEVERLYSAPITVQELPTLVGRKIYVFPLRKLSAGAATRGGNRINWTVGVLGVERCTDAGSPKAAWMDNRVEWMESVIEEAVDFDGREGEYLEFAGRTLWTIAIETDIYDVDHQDEHSLFWSTIEVTFEEIAEA